MVSQFGLQLGSIPLFGVGVWSSLSFLLLLWFGFVYIFILLFLLLLCCYHYLYFHLFILSFAVEVCLLALKKICSFCKGSLLVILVANTHLHNGKNSEIFLKNE